MSDKDACALPAPAKREGASRLESEEKQEAQHVVPISNCEPLSEGSLRARELPYRRNFADTEHIGLNCLAVEQRHHHVVHQFVRFPENRSTVFGGGRQRPQLALASCGQVEFGGLRICATGEFEKFKNSDLFGQREIIDSRDIRKLCPRLDQRERATVCSRVV